MHVLNQVQNVYVDACEPVHHTIVLRHHLIIIEVLGSDRTVLRTYLLLALLIDTAVDCVEKALCKVCTCAEELHLLTGLCCRYAAADGVVIAPNRTHHVIVLVLDGGSANRDLCSVLLEVLRKSLGVENRKVWLWSRAHVLKGVQETVVTLRNHGSAILAHTADLEGSPNRVTGEELVVGRDTCELHHTKLHNEVIDELLCFLLGEGAFLEVTLDVDIEEGGHTTNGHRCTVLGLDRCEVTEVEPLNSFLRVLRRSGNVITVALCHLLHLLEGTNLIGDLLSLTDDVIGHGAVTGVGIICHLLLDQEIDTVESNSSVVADDTATAVGIWKTGEDLVMTNLHHLRCVRIENALVVGLVVLGEDLVKLRIRCVTVGGASLLCHLDTTVRHECSLQWLISLKTYDLLEILLCLVDVCCAVSGDAGNDLGLHIEHAALCTLFLLKCLNLVPELIGRLCRAGKEAGITVVCSVVLLDE